MSKIIETSELMELSNIDPYNESRVKAWQTSAEADIVGFTGFNIASVDIDTTTLDKDKLNEFISIAKVYLQETVRTLFLSPNYDNERGLNAMQLRLKELADNLTGEKTYG